MQKWTGFFILITLLGGCTEKGRSIHPHQSDIRQSAPDSGTSIDKSQEPMAEVKGLSLNQLADKVLSPARIRDPKSLVSRQIRDELLALNSMLLKNPEPQVLKRYSEALALDCGDFRSSCAGLNYFRQAASSAQVARVAALQTKDDVESTRLILSALSIKNSEYDGELVMLLLERSERVAGKLPVKLQDAVRSMLDTAIITADFKARSEQEISALLQRVKIWDLIQNPAWNLSEGAKTSLWSIAARGHALPAKGQKGDAGYQRFAKTLSEDPNGVLSVQKSLRAQKMFDPTAMSASFIEELDGLNLIVDAVFTSRLTPQGAALIFAASGHSAAELFAVVENYIRLRFALTTHQSTLEIKTIMKANVTTEQLYAHTVRESAAVKRYWTDLRNKLQQVRVFSTIALKNAGGAKEEQLISGMFESFDHQVNLTSVYPHMLALFYFLSKKEFFVDLVFNGRMTTATILSHLYFGAIKPQVEYSEERRPLNHFEILYAFDTAVRTGLFATLEIGIDEFISNSLLRLTEVPATKIRDHLDGIENHYQESTLSTDFKNACVEFTTGVKMRRQIKLDDLIRSPYYGNVLHAANSSVTDGIKNGSSQGLFYGDNVMGEIAELVRLDLPQHIRTAEAMLSSYESYLRKTLSLKPEQIKSMTPKTHAVIARLNALRERLLRNTAKYELEQGKCLVKMNNRDLEMQLKIMKMEAQHLREVHQDIVNLRAGRPMEFVHEFQGLPSNYKGSEAIDKGGYSTNKFDLYLRLGQFIEKVEPQIDVNFGEHINIDVWGVRLAATEPRRVQFVEDREKFVNAGLRSYFPIQNAWLTWHYGDDRISIWPSYVKSLSSLYRLERDFTGKSTIMTPERIIEAHEEYVKMTNLNADQRDFLQRLGMSYYYSNDQFTERLFNYSQSPLSGLTELQEIFGVLDVPAFYANEARLGINFDLKSFGLELTSSFEPRRFGYSEYAKLYYKIRAKTNRGTPLIPTNPDVDHFMDDSLRDWVKRETSAGLDFYKVLLKHVADVEATPADQRLHAELTLNVRINDILTPSLYSNFTAGIKTMNRETQNCFVRQCDDFD